MTKNLGDARKWDRVYSGVQDWMVCEDMPPQSSA